MCVVPPPPKFLTSHLPGAAEHPQGPGFAAECAEEGPGVKPAFVFQTWGGENTWGGGGPNAAGPPLTPKRSSKFQATGPPFLNKARMKDAGWG